jgi:molecular chaperone DnaK
VCLLGCTHTESTSIVVDRGTAISPDGTLNESIGIETLGGVFTPLLTKGCKLPCSLSQTFSTAEVGQGDILIHLFRGDAPLAKSTRSLGTFRISGIAPMPRGEPSIRVEFKADKGGITLTATDTKGKSRLSLLRVFP